MNRREFLGYGVGLAGLVVVGCNPRESQDQRRLGSDIKEVRDFYPGLSSRNIYDHGIFKSGDNQITIVSTSVDRAEILDKAPKYFHFFEAISNNRDQTFTVKVGGKDLFFRFFPLPVQKSRVLFIVPFGESPPQWIEDIDAQSLSFGSVVPDPENRMTSVSVIRTSDSISPVDLEVMLAMEACRMSASILSTEKVGRDMFLKFRKIASAYLAVPLSLRQFGCTYQEYIQFLDQLALVIINNRNYPVSPVTEAIYKALPGVD